MPDREKIRELYNRWEEACAASWEADVKVDEIAQELQEYDIDPEDPPEWLVEDE